MSGFDKEFGKFTLKKLNCGEQCPYSKEICKYKVSIYEEDCKKCYVASGEKKEKSESVTR